jgi:hypothetical protein
MAPSEGGPRSGVVDYNDEGVGTTLHRTAKLVPMGAICVHGFTIIANS